VCCKVSDICGHTRVCVVKLVTHVVINVCVL
jgi:hypothetical protein